MLCDEGPFPEERCHGASGGYGDVVDGGARGTPFVKVQAATR
jgi:hypothetical protein